MCKYVNNVGEGSGVVVDVGVGGKGEELPGRGCTL